MDPNGSEYTREIAAGAEFVFGTDATTVPSRSHTSDDTAPNPLPVRMATVTPANE
jgi:hypothetical protein